MKTAMLTVSMLLLVASCATPQSKSPPANQKGDMQSEPHLSSSDLSTPNEPGTRYNAALKMSPENLMVNMQLEKLLHWSGVSTTPDGHNIYTFVAIIDDAQGESYRTGKVRLLNGKAEVLEMHLL